MKLNRLILAGFVAGWFAAAPAPAQEIQYWGKWPGTDRGLIQLQGQYFTVAEGDEVAGMGTVDKVTDDGLLVRRTLTEEEKRSLAAQGRAAPDRQEHYIGNQSRRFVPLPGR